MQLLLTPGRSSSNVPFEIDMLSLPHLFISFTEEMHFAGLVKKICDQLISIAREDQLRLAIAVNKQNADIILNTVPAAYFFRNYITNEITEPVADSPLLFMRTIIKELKKRMKRAGFQVEQETGIAKKAFTPLIFLSDNILDLVIIGRKKSIGFDFMQLLIQGPAVGIHCIVASSNSYQNMLKQLMRVHPSVIMILEKNREDFKSPGRQALGAELIISGEGLLFYKDKESKIHTKFYP